MRYLTIVRHAKAVSATPRGADYDRALNKRGRAQCAQLREWASDARELGRFGPTTALVSAAARTRETFELAFDGTPFVAQREFSDLIYNGYHDVWAEDVLRELASIDPGDTSLMVVAHNPTVHVLMHALAVELPEPLRTGAYPLAGAFVLAMDELLVGRSRYDVVASYVPD